jgi:type II secretory pathway component GspD/PulD (secretin)
MKRTLKSAACLSLPFALIAFSCASSESPDDTNSAAAPHSASSDAPLFVGTAQEPGDSDLQQGIQAKSLRDQKTAMLVNEHVRRARMAYSDARLLEAENELVAALGLDNSSQEARALLEDVHVALGKADTNITGSSSDVVLATQARAERSRADAQGNLTAGRNYLNEGNYNVAIGKLRLAKSAIDGSSLQIAWGSMTDEVNTLLAQAEAERDLALAAQRSDEQFATFEALQGQRRMEIERRNLRLDAMLVDAIGAFDAAKYDDAITLCEDIIREDPLYGRARELSDASQKARHTNVEQKWLEQRSERFQDWQEDVDEARILNNNIMTLPDPTHWKQISEQRLRFRETQTGGADSELNLQLLEDINTQRIPSLIFEGETSLDTVIDQLRTFTSIPFVITPDAIEAVDSAGIEFNLNMTHELSVANALNIITDVAGTGVTYTFKHGVVYITSTAKAHGNLILRPHEVRDLTALVVDFSGPKLDAIRLPDEEYNDEDGSAFGGTIGESLPMMDPDALAALVQQSVATSTWDTVEGASIVHINGQLFVRHTPEVHQEIENFLEKFRSYTSSMVNIEARFLTITNDYLQEIGIDWRGNGGNGSTLDLVNLDDVTSGFDDNSSLGLDNNGPGLPSGADSNPSAGAYFDEFSDGDIRARTENILGSYGSRLGTTGGLAMQLSFLDDLQYSLILEAVEKSQNVQELTSTSLSAQNTRRAYATMLNQITYVQDFDVEVALAAFIADPVIGVISDGIVLDVRPTISQSRKYITLELRPTIATIVQPITEFTSSLAALTVPITVQLPELQISSANTTVVVPDGGTVVIGGLKKLFNIDQRADIPFLSDIPVLSLLFKKEGEAEENRDIILMIRAEIVDANEMKAALDTSLGR